VGTGESAISMAAQSTPNFIEAEKLSDGMSFWRGSIFKTPIGSVHKSRIEHSQGGKIIPERSPHVTREREK
jgi:hypothetical protein